ncbi:hypothetical protein [Moraxella lacunata]
MQKRLFFLKYFYVVNSVIKGRHALNSFPIKQRQNPCRNEWSNRHAPK